MEDKKMGEIIDVWTPHWRCQDTISCWQWQQWLGIFSFITPSLSLSIGQNPIAAAYMSFTQSNALSARSNQDWPSHRQTSSAWSAWSANDRVCEVKDTVIRFAFFFFVIVCLSVMSRMMLSVDGDVNACCKNAHDKISMIPWHQTERNRAHSP